MFDMSVSDALSKREHLIALGDTTIYVRNDDDFPFDRVVRVESGGSYRLSGPASAYLLAEVDGLTFQLSVDFEQADANGRGASLFDRVRLRDVMGKLSAEGRRSFADMLEREVMPALGKRSADLRMAMNEQLDSEDCVRGLIAFGSAAA